MTETTKANIALLGANLFYGAGFSVAKTIMPRLIQPYGFIFIRVSVTCLLFWFSYLLGKKENNIIDKKDWVRLALCALFGIAINQLMFFKGLSLTSPIHASLIMLSTPILVTFTAAFSLKERLNGMKVIGLFLGAIGAFLLVYLGKKSNLSSNPALGDLFVFFNAASYAIYLVIVKPLMKKYRPIVVIRWVFTLGFLMVLPFGLGQFNTVQWQFFQWKDMAALVFIVVFVTFFTYLWNTYALKILSASTAGSYIFLQPCFAAIIAVAFFAEEVTSTKIIAAILIFSGVFLVGRKVS